MWHRTSPQSRGYDHRWVKRRLLVLQRDFWLCQCDDCRGGEKRLRPAHEVDHIIPKALFESGKVTGDPDAMDNLRAVNRECHKRITAEQRGYSLKPRYNAQGYRIANK